MDSVISEIVKASPYLGFVLLFIWFDAQREEKRIKNATEAAVRREQHENVMQDRQIKHDDDVIQLYASFNQQLVQEIKLSHQAIMTRLTEHEEESEKRYQRMGITKDLLKAANEKTRR